MVETIWGTALGEGPECWPVLVGWGENSGQNTWLTCNPSPGCGCIARMRLKDRGIYFRFQYVYFQLLCSVFSVNVQCHSLHRCSYIRQ